jgi:hypothetical protein
MQVVPFLRKVTIHVNSYQTQVVPVFIDLTINSYQMQVVPVLIDLAININK